MLITFSKRTACWTASGVLISLVGFAAFLHLFKFQDDDVLENRVVMLESKAVQHPQDVHRFPETNLSIDVAVDEDDTEFDPRVDCHDPLGVLSEECLRSLDAYFLDRPFSWKDFEWLRFSMTYRRIFADPEGDIDRVIDALARPECRLDEGEIRWDLKESCYAESFANYANFLDSCQYVAEGTALSSNESIPLRETSNVDVRQTTYERHDRWTEEKLLEERWIVEEKCVRHDLRKLVLDSTRNQKEYGVLEAVGRKLEIFPQSSGSSSMDAFLYQLTDGKIPFGREDAINVLRTLAARLGDSWAASVYESIAEDEEWNVHEAKTMPWKKYIEVMHSAMNWIQADDVKSWVLFQAAIKEAPQEVAAMGDYYLKNGAEARTIVLAYALGAWGELGKTDMMIDLDRLVEFVCDPNWKKRTQDCQQVIGELNEIGTSTDQHFWRRLSQFEARAIELDLYNVVPSYRIPD